MNDNHSTAPFSEDCRLYFLVLEIKVLEVSHIAANIANLLAEVRGIPKRKRVTHTMSLTWCCTQNYCLSQPDNHCVVTYKCNPETRSDPLSHCFVGHFKKSVRAKTKATESGWTQNSPRMSRHDGASCKTANERAAEDPVLLC